MGLNVNGLRFLLWAKSTGVDFTRTAMIGRQRLHLSFEQFCKTVREEFKQDVTVEILKIIYGQKYCENLLRYLGATVVHSFDYSNYEGATHVHDFNQPISDNHFSEYTTVIEGGSLEHIFNFPNAIKNCMEMVKVGGHYLGISPANNYMGHGFYQFSPELYFRVFSRDNGFQIEQVFAHEGRDSEQWFTIPDPEQVKRRVGARSFEETLMLIVARRLEVRAMFSSPPLQSDYVATWDKGAEVNTGTTKEARFFWKGMVVRRLKEHIKKVIGRSPMKSAFRIVERFN